VTTFQKTNSKRRQENLLTVHSVRTHGHNPPSGVAIHSSRLRRHHHHRADLHLLLEGSHDPRAVQVRADAGQRSSEEGRVGGSLWFESAGAGGGV
ncbi:hypothetical protein T310_9125, partial [Rasamsonia emersonii CBS 393.64]